MNEINFEIQDIKKIDLSMDVGVKEIFPPIENLEVNPSKEQQVFNHENSYGYDEVIVNPIPDEYIIPDGTLDVNANGDVDVTMFRMARVGVYTPPNLQDKELTINENGTHNIVADEEYDGLKQVSVTVNAIEDLTEELNTYNTELTEQETKIADVIELLQTKATPSCAKYAPQTIAFYNYKGNDLSYEIENLDTSKITSLAYLFYGCNNITSIDLSNHTFGTITNIYYFCFNCNSLTELKLPSFETSGMTAFQSVFSSCHNLTELDLSKCDLSEVTNTYNAFYTCRSLKKLNISTMDLTKLTYYTGMFEDIPTDCEFIVKDEKSKSWMASKFSKYTNVKTVAELEG